MARSFQMLRRCGGMSVRENPRMGACRRRADKAGVAGDLEGVHARFPRLRERRGVNSGARRGRGRQMLSVGRGLMSRPRMLRLAEPPAALAPRGVEEIAEAMRGLRALGLALLVEQTGGMALGVAERLHLIRGGRLASEKAVDDGAGIDEPRDF
tara:strand:- start:116 stop:577 length:462 start_codon:yes stop_codon:yes gene_type:complete